MPMPGAGDPYLYEWYVGLENVIKMLNPDSGIQNVIFQHDEYDTIDDVVVENINGNIQMCYQVKHNVATAEIKSLTFGNMIEKPKGNKCLFEAMAKGWIHGCASSGLSIIPILFTNKKIHTRRSRRTFKDETYSAYSIDKFLEKMKLTIETIENDEEIYFTDHDLECQWKELRFALSSVDYHDLINFIKVFQIEGNERNLDEMKSSLIKELCSIFACSENIAWNLFAKLLCGLTEWVTTTREKREVTIEDVYNTLSIDEDVEENQHRLIYPSPFFESRRVFCASLVKQIQETKYNIIFLHGEPGSGKTSTISYLQSEYDLFLLRYHTFRPISPEQHFYNTDSGIYRAEDFWGALLIQLRKHFKGHLAEYNVPVSNKLLTIREMRSHVLRLLAILGKKAISLGRKEYVCIDGIDHAARANINTTFLSTLPLPEEIPEGICFVLVGQPISMYSDQYPIWLSNNELSYYISLPKLEVSDIKQLILEKANQFAEIANELAELLNEKTAGNNLSTVFAVEEIKRLNTIDDVYISLESGHICGDIQQYYNHIWTYMKNELIKMLPSINFSDSIVACAILAFNGHINTRILSLALEYDIKKLEWNMLMDKLFPLIIPIDKNENYTIFHNDFRVFLMGIVNHDSLYKRRLEEIAFSLGKYLLQNDEGLISYVLGIQLLKVSNKEYLIPRYFTPEFVINALAEGVSEARLDEYAHLSYNSACNSKDYLGYRNTYLAIKTLYQHKKYYEYYQKEYLSKDFPEIASIDISEIRSLSISKDNIEEFNNMLELCCKLYCSDDDNNKKRALKMYDKWLKGYTPISLQYICADSVSEDETWRLEATNIGIFLKNWGKTAAKLNIEMLPIRTKLSVLESYSVFIFGEQYFCKCIEDKKYDLAIDAIKAGYVDMDAFSSQLESIYYAGVSYKFYNLFVNVNVNIENPSLYLLALSMSITCNKTFMVDSSVLDSLPTITRLYDRSTFTLVLKSFILGNIMKDSEDKDLLKLSDVYCKPIDESEKHKEQIAFILQLAILLGKYYWSERCESELFRGHLIRFFSTNLKYRPFDYSKARKFLIYTILNSRVINAFALENEFLDSLRKSLIELDSISMFYKSIILDFLVKINNLSIVKEYINKLYGENCDNIIKEESKADIHKHFCKYGKLVEPDLIKRFSERLKWDVVGYIGHDEYSLYAPLQLFKNIVDECPFRWRDLGAELYQQSQIANLYSNKVEYEINCCLTETATICGIEEYCDLRRWDEEFGINPDQIYRFILKSAKNTKTIDGLKLIWILSCGIHSWYTQSERLGAETVFKTCLERANIFNLDFYTFVAKYTPEWINIFKQLNKASSEVDKLVNNVSLDKTVIYNLYNSMSVEESVEYLRTIENAELSSLHFSLVLEKINLSDNSNDNYLHKLFRRFCEYLQDKWWENDNCEFIINTLLTKMGDDAFWGFAEANCQQLSDYDYQISTSNMQLLFRLMCKGNLVETENLFKEELRTQKMWVFGNNHFCLDYSCHESESNLNIKTSSFSELVFYILLEQVDTNNARKVESAIYAIYLLGLSFLDISSYITKTWFKLSKAQKEALLIVIYKWSCDEIISDEFQKFLLDKYNESSELSIKYYLHTILIKLGEKSIQTNTVSCTAPGYNYKIHNLNNNYKDNYFANFISLICNYKGEKEASEIINVLSSLDPIMYTSHDRFGDNCDISFPILKEYPDKIFYSKEKTGDWNNIPLKLKKARLLPPEDPFLLTEMPHMVFDNKLFPNSLESYDERQEHPLSTSELHNIIYYNNEDEITLASCLWYPWGYESGAIYMQFSKLDLPIDDYRPNILDLSLGNYGMLINERAIDETKYTKLGSGGISLFNSVCGSIKLYFDNCQLTPSSAWRDLLGCNPKKNNPFIWENSIGIEVLRFERIASPTRDIMNEPYFRQPILFRWMCKKTWLGQVLLKKGLRLIAFDFEKPYPSFRN